MLLKNENLHFSGIKDWDMGLNCYLCVLKKAKV